MRLQRRPLLTEAARHVRDADRAGPPAVDPGPEAVVSAALDWLGRAQDRSVSNDGGVARHYSLIHGWTTSYPETTGYIVPTMLAGADWTGRDDPTARARRMLDWLAAIQLADGGFQGGRVDARPVRSVTFNTGQILIGLAAGVRAFGDSYADALHGAARFLRDSLDADGCWRANPSPFAVPGEKAYETHVAWGLLEADLVFPGHGYGDAALRQIAWALTKQERDGWVRDCCLNEPRRPLTHTIGYFLRGVLAAYRGTGEARHLDAARRTADALLSAQAEDGRLPGRLRRGWRPAARWTCLTGLAQIAECWTLLARATGDERYDAAAGRARSFLRRTVALDGPADVRGGVKGAHPVDGDYGPYEYLNWAAKFTIDAHLRAQIPDPLARYLAW